MRKALIVILLFTIIIFITDCNYSPSSGIQHPLSVGTSIAVGDPRNFVNETLIQYFDAPYLYNLAQLNNGITDFENKYAINTDISSTKLNDTPFKVSYDNLLTLLKVLQSSTTGMGYNPRQHLSAIKFTYGINNGMNDSLVLIIEPIYLITKAKVDVPDAEFYKDTTNNVSAGKYFCVDVKGNFTPINNVDEMTTLSDNYKTYIQINHGLLSRKEFRYATDIRSCIMTFQEINQTYCDNKANTSDSVSFQLVASQIEKKGSYKLHVIAYFETPYNKYNLSFKGYAADFAQLCPTYCSDVVVKISK